MHAVARSLCRLGLSAAAISLALLALLPGAWARSATDAAGRTVQVPDTVSRVFSAGPPASTLLYVLAPDAMTGWVRAPRPAEKPWLLPSVWDLPETGRLTGRGDTVNLEGLLAAHPDLVLDAGTVSPTYVSLADRVQSQTGIPYVLLDGSLDRTPATLRLMGDILGRRERADLLAGEAQRILDKAASIVERVQAGSRPRVYIARGPDGLETAVRGSINAEIVEKAGGENVAEGVSGRGNLATVSVEQVITWAPDVIVAIDPAFAASVAGKAEWQAVPAVRDGQILLAPSLPFSFIDAPPSVNRLIGLVWLLNAFQRGASGLDVEREVTDFYRTFYGLDLAPEAVRRLLAGSTAPP